MGRWVGSERDAIERLGQRMGMKLGMKLGELWFDVGYVIVRALVSGCQRGLMIV